jgi:phospholipid N-methyltransferase
MSEYIGAVDTAKLIRKALNGSFQGQKFYVRTETYSGGASIHVYWMDGPTQKEVESVVNSYKGSGFDAVIDLKYYVRSWLMPNGSVVATETRGTVDSGGMCEAVEVGRPHPDAREVNFIADHIFCEREFSRGFLERIVTEVQAKHDVDAPKISDSKWWVGGKDRGASAYFERDVQCSLFWERAWETNAVPHSEIEAMERHDLAPVEWFCDLPLFGWLSDESRAALALPEYPERKRNQKLAQRLRDMADKISGQIDSKRNPAISSQNWTPRRAKIVESMAREADELERVQYALYALADAHADGSIPPILVGVTTKLAVEHLLIYRDWPRWEDAQKLMVRAGLAPDTIGVAHDALAEIVEPPDRSGGRRLRELENEVRGMVRRVPGFFPTPAKIASRMVGLACIRDESRVLEPSAGGGAIADAIRGEYPGVVLEVIEWNSRLREFLEAKGYDVIGSDFFAVDGQKWDRIIQNPPFENMQDVDHVIWAYEHLSDDGVLVSIVSESPFFRSDKKAAHFRRWLTEVGAYVEDLGIGAFAECGANVKARIVVVRKEKG